MDRLMPEAIAKARNIIDTWTHGQEIAKYKPLSVWSARRNSLVDLIAAALIVEGREIEDLRAASQLALDCHYHDEPHCECWIPSARAAAQGGVVMCTSCTHRSHPGRACGANLNPHSEVSAGCPCSAKEVYYGRKD